jgi:pre-rRNA-processing protein IPI1
MSHIEPDIRGDSTRFFKWVLAVGGEEVMARGGWSKGLTALVGVLGFLGDAESSSKSGGLLKHLEVLSQFLEKGLSSDESDRQDHGEGAEWDKGLHWSIAINMTRSGAAGYKYLGLFCSGQDEDEVDGIDGRRRWMSSENGKVVVGRIKAGLVGLTKDGGEIGRAAGRVLSLL